jgi:osmotically-inducible protein OsmY
MTPLSKVACAAILATTMWACDRGPDPAEQVEDALEAAQIDDVNVNYDRDSKAVHLTGTVDSPDVKRRAEEIAARAVGTSGSILNELTVEGPSENKADDLDGSLRELLNDMIDRDATLTDRDVNFDVNNGAVEIKGSVASAAEKARVGEMVRSVPGVKDMANGLEIQADKYPNAKRPAGTTYR